MTRLRMGVVGVGHLGKEHARILAGMPEVELIGVADINYHQAAAVAQNCHTRAFSDYNDLIGQVDAVSVVVPTSQHFAVAGTFLCHGVAVLVEKPLALNAEQGAALVELARREKTVLQVGHIERFNPAYEALRRRPLQPKFIRCERHGPFTGRSTDIGVVLDLMIHDLDLLLHLVGAPVVSVEALGVSVLGGEEDVADARLHFSTGCVAAISASRVSPVAQRRMQLWAPEGYAQIDFATRQLTLVGPTEQFRRHGLDVSRLDPRSRAFLKDELFGKHFQSLTLECTSSTDQLTRELQDFVCSANTGARPRVSGRDGQDALSLAMRVLERVHSHSWDGPSGLFEGPRSYPSPLDTLFPTTDRQAA